MNDSLVVTVYAAWLVLSAGALWRLGLLDPAPLRTAPPRRSQLNYWHAGASCSLYVSTALLATMLLARAAGVTAEAAGPATWPATRSATQATTEAATQAGAPVTTRVTTRATTRAAPTPATSPAAVVVTQIGDMFGKVIGGIAILVLAGRLVVGGPSGFGVSARQLPRGLWLGLLAALLLAPWIVGVETASSWVGSLIRHGPTPIHPILKDLETHPGAGETFVLALSACLIAPLGEELFFRGMLQTVLLRVLRRRAAATAGESVALGAAARWGVIVLVSILFASVHFDSSQMNFEVLPVLFLLALALGYTYERTGNLWASVTLHALFNSVSVAAVILGTAGHGS